MKKELLIDGTTYVFHLFEEFKIWRLMENTNLFHAQKLDLEIDLNTVSNFKWEDKDGSHQRILFYPFIPKSNLKYRKLSETARRANYKMFNYIGLDKLPHFVLYEK